MHVVPYVFSTVWVLCQYLISTGGNIYCVAERPLKPTAIKIECVYHTVDRSNCVYHYDTL